MPGDHFKDHFSGHAAAYARRRPRYPAVLFDWLAAQAPGQKLAWDCATGSGQAAVVLAEHFDRVIATDASVPQIENASHRPGVEYGVAPAEESGLADSSVDLVTVAQALHWFDLPAFYAEAERVLKPAGLIAAWCYGLFRVAPEIDELVDRLYSDVVGPWWPPERELVESNYAGLPFPWQTLETPIFEMEASWSAGEALGYLETWSAVQRCRRETGEDPLASIAGELAERWGEAPRRVTWPLAVRAGRA